MSPRGYTSAWLRPFAEPASVSPGAVMVTSGNLAAIVKQGLGLRPNPLLRAVAKHDGDSRLYRRLPVLCPEWRLGYSLDAGHIQHTRGRQRRSDHVRQRLWSQNRQFQAGFQLSGWRVHATPEHY